MGTGGLTGEAFVKNEVWLQFADGEYLFKLKLPQLAELQEKCEAGIGTIYGRVALGDFYAVDLIETIRLGLIGGGEGVVNESTIKVNDLLARKLIARYCDRPLDELHKLAHAILGACVVGYVTDAEEDKKPGNQEAEVTEPIGSTSPPPTQTELPAEE